MRSAWHVGAFAGPGVPTTMTRRYGGWVPTCFLWLDADTPPVTPRPDSDVWLGAVDGRQEELRSDCSRRQQNRLDCQSPARIRDACLAACSSFDPTEWVQHQEAPPFPGASSRMFPGGRFRACRRACRRTWWRLNRGAGSRASRRGWLKKSETKNRSLKPKSRKQTPPRQSSSKGGPRLRIPSVPPEGAAAG